MDSDRKPLRGQCPLDVDELQRRCLGRLDLVERVLARFQQALGDDIRSLTRAFLDSEIDQVAFFAHRIKGASSAVSAHAIAEYAQEIEILATTRQLAEVNANLYRLKQECEKIESLSCADLFDSPHGQPTSFPEDGECEC